MKYLARGSFGVVLGIGGAFAITRALDDDYVVAAVIAVLTVIIALAVFLTVDRKREAVRR